MTMLGGEAISAMREAFGATEEAALLAESSAPLSAELTDHAAMRAEQRGITGAQIDEAIQSAKQSGNFTDQTGKYGTPQVVYKGDNGVTVIQETSGRNAGKIITTYKH